MAMVSLKSLLEAAAAGDYAVGAFNCNNMEIVQAIIGAAERENSPVIIQASQGALKYAGLEYITALVQTAAAKSSIPAALHLDHGTSFTQVMQCIRAGFTSVMFDGSALLLEENIAITRRIVEVAHAVGVSVEAELGRIPGTEDELSVGEQQAFFTDPDQAREFVAATGVDALAVAIGTAHGHYRGEPKLDFPRLSRIAGEVPVPLVLHGSSGVPDASVRQAVSLGIRKINIDTDIREAFTASLREVLATEATQTDPRKILGPAREAAEEVIRQKMRVFGCAGRAS